MSQMINFSISKMLDDVFEVRIERPNRDDLVMILHGTENVELLTLTQIRLALRWDTASTVGNVITDTIGNVVSMHSDIIVTQPMDDIVGICGSCNNQDVLVEIDGGALLCSECLIGHGYHN